MALAAACASRWRWRRRRWPSHCTVPSQVVGGLADGAADPTPTVSTCSWPGIEAGLSPLLLAVGLGRHG